MAEGEGEEEPKKKGKAKLIAMIVLISVIGLLAAKMTVLKPPPLTPHQKADADTIANFDLDVTCSMANGLPLPAIPKTYGKPPTTTTTMPGSEPAPVSGPVLTIDSQTYNLAGNDASGNPHFLKIGLALQLQVGAVADTISKTENWSAITGQIVLDKFAGQSMDDILPTKTREQIRKEIGKEVCMKSEGKATTVYFTEFVAQ